MSQLETTTEAPRGAERFKDPMLLWGLGSALLIALGSLGTWATVGPISLSGTDDGRDGILTLILALVALVPMLIGKARPVVGVLAVICLGIGIYDTVDVSSIETPIWDASPGWGLYLVDVAAASLLAWTFLGKRTTRR